MTTPTTPTTPTGKRLVSYLKGIDGSEGRLWYDEDDLLAIEHEAAAAEHGRLKRWEREALAQERWRDEARADADRLAEALRHAVNEYPDEFYAEDLGRFREALRLHEEATK